jgi:hypothetical protein
MKLSTTIQIDQAFRNLPQDQKLAYIKRAMEINKDKSLKHKSSSLMFNRLCIALFTEDFKKQNA